MARWQRNEIDRDFKIFAFILFMTSVLAGVGVANSILIQVQARSRELSVLRALGVSRRGCRAAVIGRGRDWLGQRDSGPGARARDRSHQRRFSGSIYLVRL